MLFVGWLVGFLGLGRCFVAVLVWFDFSFCFVSFFVWLVGLQYWGLNSGPTPQTALSYVGCFQDRISQTISQAGFELQSS
jgi:hypothetical protein